MENDRAGEILDRYWNHNPPVDVVSICHNLGLIVKIAQQAQWDAALDVESRTIYVLAGTESRQRFAIAHELAHWELHRDGRKAFRCKFDSNERFLEEALANRFALDLLAPWNYVMAYARYESVPEMARRFQVSDALIQHRMKHPWG
jgi:Zn-dependent peptidase ImmA (M78 family)